MEDVFLLKPSNYSRLQPINRNNDRKILIVDDNQSILSAAESMIEHWGFQAFTAENGKEAVKKFRNIKPDAVVMDIRMPEMDGYEAFLKIRRYYPDAKVFLMTAYKSDPRIKQGEKKGILYVFEKPFSLRELKDKLIQHLGRGKPFQ